LRGGKTEKKSAQDWKVARSPEKIASPESTQEQFRSPRSAHKLFKSRRYQSFDTVKLTAIPSQF
jgi:hypothetical protein